MNKNSSVAVEVERESREFLFCVVAISIYDIMLFDKKFEDKYFVQATKYFFNVAGFIKIRKAFFSSVELRNKSNIRLTASDCIVLLSLLDHICKTLLNNEHDELRSIVESKIPAMTTDWEENFLKSSEIIFSSFKDMFNKNKDIKKALQKITSRKFE